MGEMPLRIGPISLCIYAEIRDDIWSDFISSHTANWAAGLLPFVFYKDFIKIQEALATRNRMADIDLIRHSLLCLILVNCIVWAHRVGELALLSSIFLSRRVLSLTIGRPSAWNFHSSSCRFQNVAT